jgi:autotransporter-associated beta strand protein
MRAMTLLRLASALGRLLALLAIAGPLSFAQGGETWDGNGSDNDWTTNNNWTPNGEPPNDGTANIVMAGTNRLTPNVDVDWDVRSLVFSNTAGAFSIFGGSGVSLGVGEGGIVNQDAQTQIVLVPIDLNASQTWSASQGQLNVVDAIAGPTRFSQVELGLSGPNAMQISGAITGNVAVNKTGSGTLTFNSVTTNSYNRPTTVSAGTLVLNRTGGSNRAIPNDLVIGDGFGSDTVRLDSANQISEAAGNTVTVNSSGLLNLNGFNETLQNLAFNGGTVSGGVTLVVSGAISSSASSTAASLGGGALDLGGAAKTITVAEGAAAVDLQISSTMDDGSLIKEGAGTLMLSGSESNWLGTTSINGGTVLLNKSAGAGALRGTVIGDGIGSDVLRLMGHSQIWTFVNDELGGFEVLSSTTVKSSGLLDLNGFTDTLLRPKLEGGSIVTGAGTLIVVGPLEVLPSPQTAAFTGNLEFRFDSDDEIQVADGPAADDLLFNGPLGFFVKQGAGQMRLTGSSSVPFFFDPPSVVIEQGKLVLAKTAADVGIIGDVTVGTIGASAGTTLQLAANDQIQAYPFNDVIIRSGAKFDLAGFSDTINDLHLVAGGMLDTGGGALTARNLILQGSTLNPTSGNVTINGSITGFAALIDGNVNITAPNLSVNVADAAAATDFEIARPLGGQSLTKIGAGTLLLSGLPNTYTGATTVSEGVLLLGKSAVDGSIQGDLTVNNATVRLAGSEQIAPSGAVTLNAGTLDLNGFTENIGSLALNNGVVSGGDGTLVVTGNLSLNGGAVAMGAGTLAVTGGITQGAAAASSISGRLDLGGAARTITTDDVPLAAVDLDVSAEVIDGGIVKQGAGALRLGGNSTFAGGVNLQGGKLLVAHDDALGTGVLRLAGGVVEADDGPRSISTAVVVASLSTVSGSNDLTLGGSFTSNLGGALFKSGAGALTIAGPQTHAPGATLFATDGTVNFNSSATGATLSVNLSNAGALVHFNADQDLNTLVVNGGRARVGDAAELGASSLSLDADAVLELELGGPIAGSEFAQLLVSGNAALGGALEITLTNGFSPTFGQSFDILDWGSLSGTFSSLNLPALGGAATWDASQLYTTGVLSVVNAIAYSADFDSDGDVDGDDLVDWRGDFGVNDFSDADDDGDSDGADFLAWQRQLGGGAPAASRPQSAVPEPGALALAWIAVCGSNFATRRGGLRRWP